MRNLLVLGALTALVMSGLAFTAAVVVLTGGLVAVGYYVAVWPTER